MNEYILNQQRALEVSEYKYEPKLKRMPVFSNPNLQIDFEYPKQEDLINFPLDKKIRLKEVFWKNNSMLKGL